MDVRFCEAGTIAERHACELRVLPEFAVRAPPKRASGEFRSWQNPARNFIPCPTTGDLSFLSVKRRLLHLNSCSSNNPSARNFSIPITVSEAIQLFLRTPTRSNAILVQVPDAAPSRTIPLCRSSVNISDSKS
jgi:hypothetical protein